jgi:hypothetical protein
MKHSFKRATLSKAAKAARKRNFRLYRLSGIMGNLAQMGYEMRNNALALSLIDNAMNAVHELKTYIKDGEPVTPQISINDALLLYGLDRKLSETYTTKEQ